MNLNRLSIRLVAYIILVGAVVNRLSDKHIASGCLALIAACTAAASIGYSVGEHFTNKRHAKRNTT